MEEVERHINEWLSFCQRSYSTTTVKMYRCVINQLLNFVGRNGKQLSSSAIENFLDSKYKAGGSKRLFNTYRIVIRSFCNFRQRRYGIESPANNIQKIREGRTSPRVLTEEEYKFVINFVKSPMDRDILIWLGNTGCRKEEFRQLKWGDIDPQLKFIRIVGKGGRHRVVPLNDTCREILQRYRRLPDDSPLQISAKYPGIEGSSWLCRRISRKTKMKQFGSHALRHRFATAMLRKGVDLFTISKILGHASIKTTEIYLHLNNDDLYGATAVLDVLD